MRCFLRRFLVQRGMSMLEVLVALMILALVLVSATALRMAVSGRDMVNLAAPAGQTLVRQANLAYVNGLLTNNFTSNGVVESGDTYSLIGTISTNSALGFYRMTVDLKINDDKGGARFSSYQSRILLGSPTNWWTRVIPEEPVLDQSPSVLKVTASVMEGSTTNPNVGSVSGTGDYPYGTQVWLQAIPVNGGFTFVRWHGPGTPVHGMTNSPVQVQLLEDVDVTAVFAQQ